MRTVVVRGSGSIGLRHARVLRERSDVSVVLAPLRAGRADALRADGQPAVDRLEDLPEGPLAAVIATDTGRHLADASELLPRADLLIEKPLAPTSRGVRALAVAAAEAGRRVFVAFCLRFEPSLQWVRGQLPRLGAVHAVRVVCQSYLPEWRPGTDYRLGYAARPDEGGVLRDLAHELDYAVWLFGRPTALRARLEYGRGLELPTDVAADLEWVVPDGPAVSVRLDYLTRRARRGILAQGAAGELEWDGIAQTAVLRLADGTEERFDGACPRDVLFARQADAFLGALDGASAEPLATLDEAAFIVALSDAARAAAAQGRDMPIVDWRTA